MDQPTEKRRGNKLRLVIILGVTTLATAAIGFGGLAVWNVATANNGNQFVVGSISHTNTANGDGFVCPSGVTTTPSVCHVIWNNSATPAKPGDSVGGSVVIKSTGNLNSTFTVALSGAPTGTVCGDINLVVTDGEGTPATVYSGTLSGWGTSPAIKADNGHATWLTNDTGTYTFTLTLSASAPQTDMGGSCAANVLFTQSA